MDSVEEFAGYKAAAIALIASVVLTHPAGLGAFLLSLSSPCSVYGALKLPRGRTWGGSYCSCESLTE